MRKIQPLIKYIFIFLIALLISNILNHPNNYNDPTYNYMRAYAIANGKVPYLDFNMVTTPLYALYTSIGLHIYNDFLIFIIEQSILITISFYLINKMYGNKVFLLVLLTSLVGYVNLIGTYNYMCFVMLLLILYMEKNYSNKDYLIGFIIGLSLLSKHTVGIFFIFPSIMFFYKDKKKIFRRLIGFLIPIIIFIVYLVLNNCLYQFIDLCIFGLFDFASKNGLGAGKPRYIGLIVSFMLLIGSLIIINKDKKNICNYYLISCIMFAVPLFDFDHIAMYLNCFIIMLLPYLTIDEKFIVRISIISSSLITLFFICVYLKYGITMTTNINHYKYAFNFKADYNNRLNNSKYISKFRDAIYISCTSPYYSVANELEITYLTNFNYGGQGYNGTKKLIKRIDKMHNQIFIISMDDYNTTYRYSQFNKVAAKYIIDNSKKIDEKYNLAVYYKE